MICFTFFTHATCDSFNFPNANSEGGIGIYSVSDTVGKLYSSYSVDCWAIYVLSQCIKTKYIQLPIADSSPVKIKSYRSLRPLTQWFHSKWILKGHKCTHWWQPQLLLRAALCTNTIRLPSTQLNLNFLFQAASQNIHSAPLRNPFPT